MDTEIHSATKEKSISVIQLAYELDEEDIKKFTKNPKKVIQAKGKKRAVEVSLKNLQGEELEEMEEAMAQELAEWLQEKALQTVRESKQIPEERLLRLR